LHKGPLLLILARFWLILAHFWLILAAFWLILAHFGPFWRFSDFAKIRDSPRQFDLIQPIR
jgi:hypothetical protein